MVKNNYCSTCLNYIASDPCDGCDGTEENHIYYEPDFVVRKSNWRDLPPTPAQLACIAEMCEFSIFPLPTFKGTTRGDASDYISKWSALAHETVEDDNAGDRE